MIIRVIVEHCPKCGSTDIIRNGHDYKGAQKYNCHTCGAYGTLHPQRGYSEPEKEQLCRAYQERMSMRGVQRVFGVAGRTLAQ